MPPLRSVDAPNGDDLVAAEQVVRSHLAVTPITVAPALAKNALLKVETLQPTGSFKVRGALAALSAADPACRVVTASAGNHALGLAQAAALLGRPVTVVVPATASPVKINRLGMFADLGVELVLHGDGYDAAEAHALQLVEEGGVFVSAYNDPHVIAGQRTLAVELGQQVPSPFTVAVPVGGGGLLAGVALWAADHPQVRVVAVEAAASRAVSTSVAAGRVVDIPVGPTLADGMAGGIEAGSVTVAIAAAHVHTFTAVTEDHLRTAMRVLAFEQGLIVEGAGAAAAAAVLAGRVSDDRPGAHVVALVTGRNITPESVRDILGKDHPA